MKQEYLIFVRQFQDIKEGIQKLFIKDLTPGPRKYDTKYVKAEISSNCGRMSDGDILRIRSESGILLPQPWEIKILEELLESVPGKPWEDVFKAIDSECEITKSRGL
jgi:hypothetical protein